MAESSSQARPPQNSQYHHFVPRFLLRNFADFKYPGKIVPKTSTKTKKRAPRPEKLTILDLRTGLLREGDVGNTFGIVDLYRDFERASGDQQKLEKELSVLERTTGEILARVKKSYDAGKKEFQLPRKEKDTLRRFLFIMMYRNSTFAERFKKSREDYDSDDREHMLAYMDERGFQNPRDVWFANIRAFLEVELDQDWPAGMADLSRRAYPMDARWFFMHVQAYFIAFCTPKETCDEFLLTQNVYGVYEGPHSVGAWTDYHRFASLSPKIMIVLRSLLLPCAGVEDEQGTRQMLLELTKKMHLDPNNAGSWLQDIPITRARNNYSKVVNGKVEPLPTKMSRDKHVFYFPFFPLDDEHVQKINMICLENAYDTLAIVYKSAESLRIALEFYLTDKTPGFKVIQHSRPEHFDYLRRVLRDDVLLAQIERGDKLLPYLQLLQKFATQLGSTVEPEYNSIGGPETNSTPALIVEQKVRYEILEGGTSASSLKDFDQAKRIVQLIINVDTLVRNKSGEIKRVVRQNREDLIATLPSRRVWLSVKRLRELSEGHTKDNAVSLENNQNAEDAIVDASRIFRPSSLARIIYKVFYIDHHLSQQPNFGLVKAVNLDAEGAKRMHQEVDLVFNKSGSIRNCGIAAVENAAQWLATQPRPGRDASGQDFLSRILSDEQKLEIWLRQVIEMGFDELLKDELGGEELRALKYVFFRLIYRSDLGSRVQR